LTNDHPQLGPHHGERCSPRCGRCALPPNLCLCAEVRPLELATRVLVLAHRREVHKTTNTARLVPIALSNSEVRVVGRAEDRARFADLAPHDGVALLLFPSTDSVPLTRELGDGRPVTLVAPDGNWRQASKMARNEPELARLPRIHVPEGAPSRYVLRKHPDPRRLATFEALARALGVLEGDEVRIELERVLALKIERTLWTRCPPGRGLESAGASERPR
jgi:DTW domain-containing protein